MPRANRADLPLCSPSPCTTANVRVAAESGHARKASRVPSAELKKPCVASAPSGGKVPETSQDLERFLFRLEQRRRIGSNSAKRVGPLGAGRTHRVQPERGRVEEDALAFDLLDHRSLGKHFLQGVAAGQSTGIEVEASQLQERVVFVEDGGADSVLGAEVPQKNRDDQGVGLVAGHLDEAGGAELPALFVP